VSGGRGRPRDPVARFHLGNGAVLADVWLEALGSERADAESLGVMASYVYARGPLTPASDRP
jgi:malonyl-CoA decarboxylase